MMKKTKLIILTTLSCSIKDIYMFQLIFFLVFIITSCSFYGYLAKIQWFLI
jgi:hypothetical protein